MRARFRQELQEGNNASQEKSYWDSTQEKSGRRPALFSFA